MGWWGRGPYPGKGPWSYLPPWERPGWKYGRGWCWWYLGTPAPGTYAPPPWIDRSSELKYLEDFKNYLEDFKKQVEARIEELKRSEK